MVSTSDTKSQKLFNLYPIQDEAGQKAPPPPTGFSSVTSTNVRISAKNSLTFSFIPFATLV